MKITNNGNEELYIFEDPYGTRIATRRQVLEQCRRVYPELSDEELLEEYCTVHWAWILDPGETQEITQEPQSKTIYIDPETWGPDYLWHPSVFVDWNGDIRRPAMCCLGFACHQLGTPLDLLDSVGLPSHLLEYSNKLLSKLPKEVKAFIARCEYTVSEDFAESVLKLIGPPLSGSSDDYTTWAYEGLLSKVNDWYHGLNDEDKPSKLEPTLEVLKLGFKEMGYELVYGKPQTA